MRNGRAMCDELLQILDKIYIKFRFFDFLINFFLISAQWISEREMDEI